MVAKNALDPLRMWVQSAGRTEGMGSPAGNSMNSDGPPGDLISARTCARENAHFSVPITIPSNGSAGLQSATPPVG
ncbi:MAG: hypothetical protein JWR66_2840 [Modestobacter sp.]|nr:hypothetical protein [Modestobacter sp.]